jgi:hypothetical protein
MVVKIVQVEQKEYKPVMKTNVQVWILYWMCILL